MLNTYYGELGWDRHRGLLKGDSAEVRQGFEIVAALHVLECKEYVHRVQRMDQWLKLNRMVNVPMDRMTNLA